MNKVYGLREKIKHATSSEEIDVLLKSGKTFKNASEETKRAWKSTAKFRIQQLMSPKLTQVVDTVDTKKISKKK